MTETAGKSAEVFGGVSGIPDNGLAFECYLHQIRTGGQKGEAEHPTKERYEQGVPVDVQLFAYDKTGPITGMKVELEVTLPNGTMACPRPFTMTDDGRQADHGDSDGFYGFHFTKTAMAASIATSRVRDENPETQPVLQSGNYRAVITASGKAHDGTKFTRIFEKTFQVYQRIREGDLDQDGLPADHVSYRAIEIYRHTALAGLTTPAHRVKVLDVSGGIITDYLDSGLTDGMHYFYAFRALGQGTSATPFSRPVDATAKADPYAPDGSIALDNHAASTADLTVNVSIVANDVANDYRLSQNPLTAAVPWTVLPASMATTFTFSGLSSGQTARLFFQFRSLTGNVSPPNYVTIKYLPGLDTDGDGTPDATDTDDDNDGVSDAIELNSLHTNPLKKDTDGDGYSDGVERTKGTNPLDRFSVPDTDGDGVPDGVESIYGTNPNLASSVPLIPFAFGPPPGGPPPFEIRVPTRTGLRYQLRGATSPGGRITAWPKIGSEFAGDGSVRVMTQPADARRMFYRIEIMLPPIP